jgi:hypothetical protein
MSSSESTTTRVECRVEIDSAASLSVLICYFQVSCPQSRCFVRCIWATAMALRNLASPLPSLQETRVPTRVGTGACRSRLLRRGLPFRPRSSSTLQSGAWRSGRDRLAANRVALARFCSRAPPSLSQDRSRSKWRKIFDRSTTEKHATNFFEKTITN